MNYKKLGNTGIEVSTICLGTMTWGEQNTQEEGFEQMNYALDQGVNFWDTAELYAIPPKKNTYGKTEEIIGNWFNNTKKREEIILATKVTGPGLSWIRGGGNQYDDKNLNEAVNESLKRLKTDYIDLYQLHWPERNSNFFGKLGYKHEDKNEWNKFEEILYSLDKIIKSGKVRYVGLSNETAWGLSKFLEISQTKSLPRMLSVQNPYSLLNRTYEVGLAEISIREKFVRYKTENGQLAIEKYYDIANKHGLDFAQMSLKFCEVQPFVTSVIIGATTMDQLKINIESVNVNLEEDVIKDINEVQKTYPNPCP